VKRYRAPVSMDSVLTTRAATDVNVILDLHSVKMAVHASVSTYLIVASCCTIKSAYFAFLLSRL